MSAMYLLIPTGDSATRGIVLGGKKEGQRTEEGKGKGSRTFLILFLFFLIRSCERVAVTQVVILLVGGMATVYGLRDFGG